MGSLSWVDENSTTIEGNLTADPKEWMSGGLGPPLWKFTVGTGRAFVDVVAVEGDTAKIAQKLKKGYRVRVRGRLSNPEGGPKQYKLELTAAHITYSEPRKTWFQVGRLERHRQWFRVKASSKEEALEIVAKGEGEAIEGQLEYHSTLDTDQWQVEEERSSS